MELEPQNTANGHNESWGESKPAGQEWASARGLLGKGNTQC